MSTGQNTISPEVLQRVMRIQTLTLVWMSVEAVVSLGAAWMARSPALLAFGATARSNFSQRQLCFGVFAGHLAEATQRSERAELQWEAWKGKPCCH